MDYNHPEDNFKDDINELDLAKIIEEGIEYSMNYAWKTIEEMSIDIWCKSIPFPSDRKVRILNNMINWFSDREEYEKCATLLKGVKYLENEKTS